jgi:hypothetical protein
MLVKVLEVQFWSRSYDDYRRSNIDKGIGYHLVGLSDNAIKKVVIVLRRH